MSEANPIGREEARQAIEIANKAQIIMGDDFLPFKDRYLAIASGVTLQSLVVLEHVLDHSPEIRHEVIEGWFMSEENKQALTDQIRANISPKK